MYHSTIHVTIIFLSFMVKVSTVKIDSVPVAHIIGSCSKTYRDYGINIYYLILATKETSESTPLKLKEMPKICSLLIGNNIDLKLFVRQVLNLPFLRLRDWQTESLPHKLFITEPVSMN